MRTVNTIWGPWPIWKWRLWCYWNQVKEVRGHLGCFFKGHSWEPDCTEWYCVRCHKWK